MRIFREELQGKSGEDLNRSDFEIQVVERLVPVLFDRLNPDIEEVQEDFLEVVVANREAAEVALILSFLFLNVFMGMFYVDYQGEIQTIDWGPFLLVAVPITVYAAYGIWYWLRILRRLPTFLMGRTTVSEESGVTRPVGFLIPAAILAGRLVGFASNAPLLGLAAFVCGVVAILCSIAPTSRTSPQSIESDQYAIPISLVIQLIPFLAFGFPDTLVAIIVLPSVYFLPEIRSQTSDTAALGPVLGLLIVLCCLLWPLTVNRMLRMQVLPAEIALATALFESLSNRLS